jgi:hypothetical protein
MGSAEKTDVATNRETAERMRGAFIASKFLSKLD